MFWSLSKLCCWSVSKLYGNELVLHAGQASGHGCLRCTTASCVSVRKDPEGCDRMSSPSTPLLAPLATPRSGRAPCSSWKKCMSGICTLIRYSSSCISGVVCPFLRTFPILIKHVLWIQVTMSSLVNALEGAGQWQLAISKFEELRARGIRPNVICYNAAISALAKGSQVCLLFHFSCCCPSRLVSGCFTLAGRAFETTRCLKRCVAFPSAWPPTLRCSAGGRSRLYCRRSLQKHW